MSGIVPPMAKTCRPASTRWDPREIDSTWTGTLTSPALTVNAMSGPGELDSGGIGQS